MIKTIKRILILAFTFAPAFISSVFAAGMGGSGGHNVPCGLNTPLSPPCPIPLDNGVIALLFVGAAYGGLKIYQSLQKNPA